MKAIHAFILLVHVGGVCCKPDLWLAGGKTLDAVLSASDTHSSSQHNSTSENISSVDISMAKIGARLNTSTVLADKPNIKLRLLALCETSLNQKGVAAHNHHSCLGVATGDMSLITRLEKILNIALADP